MDYEAKNGAGYVFSGSNKGYGGASCLWLVFLPMAKLLVSKLQKLLMKHWSWCAKWVATDASGDERRQGDILEGGSLQL